MSKTSTIVGPITIFFVLITLITIIFPALFSSVFGKFSSNLEPFEVGIIGIPVVIISSIVLIFGIAYYRKKIPQPIIRTIDQIRSYEISQKSVVAILIIIFGVYIGFSIPELSLNEFEQFQDFEVLQESLEIWPDGKSNNPFIEEQNDRYVRMFLLDTSQEIFHNIKILPFIASIFVVLLTYLLTVQITQKRLSGIIAILVLLQSQTFLKYDTIAVYENFWILFYLLSIYVIKKNWFLSPFFYILAFFTKAFVAPYFVMTLFFAFRTSISRKKKIAILFSYSGIIIIALGVIFAGETLYPEIVEINPSKFILGFASFSPLLRFDYLLLTLILPVVVGLTLLAKNQSKEIDSILFLIFGTLIAGPILITFTNFYEILPYRYIPLIIFFAIGIGFFFSKKTNS
mgnify:CR=1 FL=1|tara:strand:- start:1531 stop:2733 length:1203 start_codon:yes stop_codon:yes gene_type:complete